MTMQIPTPMEQALGEQDVSLQGAHLYLDCFAGIAGDMFLGAMIDLGVPEALLRTGLSELIPDGYALHVGKRAHHGIVGCDVQVRCPQTSEVEGQTRAAGQHHGHRSYRSIRDMIDGAKLTDSTKQLAQTMFERIATAEGRLHGVDPERVNFHEVGAVDSIIDIVGAAIALDFLQPVRVTCRPVPLGRGRITCAHGTLPVPSPAALEILKGITVEDGEAELELCTPTGAAIVAVAVDGFGPLPTGQLLGIGYGAGDASLPDRPNHLRAVLLRQPAGAAKPAEMVVVEANIDDMNPEWCSHLAEQLFRAGACDVWYTPIVMKKGRPAFTVSAICASTAHSAVGNALLTESTTIGLRSYAISRETLDRRWVDVDTSYGPIRIKEALHRGRLVNAAPEVDECREVAAREGVPLKEVVAVALAAHRTRG